MYHFLGNIVASSACGKPSKSISNGLLEKTETNKQYYKKGDTVRYKCSDGYAFKAVTTATCVGRNWTYPICICELKWASKHDYNKIVNLVKWLTVKIENVLI